MIPVNSPSMKLVASKGGISRPPGFVPIGPDYADDDDEDNEDEDTTEICAAERFPHQRLTTMKSQPVLLPPSVD